MAFSDAEEEVLAFLRSEQETYYRGDFEAFISHWHHGPEVRRILSGPQVGTRIHRGWDDLRPRFEEGFRQFPQDFDSRKLLRWENIQVQLVGDMAWVSYDMRTVGSVPRMHAPSFGHETKIVQRFGGEWKLVCLIVVVPDIAREDTPRIELAVDGRVVGVNDLARDRLSAHPGLTISGNRPRARQRAFDADLQAAIERKLQGLATNLPGGYMGGQPIVVPLGDDDAGQPIFCWVQSEQERILISFDDEILLRRRLERAGAVFGLSPAQLNLAELLASGRDQAAAAQTLGVSVNTIRTQARRMFEKTNTHNQAAMISRLLNLQAPR